MSKFSTWPKRLRITTWVAASVVVAALFVSVGVVAYNVVAAPRIEKAAAVACAKHYSHAEARNDCIRGSIPKAKAAEKKLDLRAKCESDYTLALAIIDCEQGHDAAADQAQSTKDADDAAAKAAAEKAASLGQQLDNPYPAGTKASMQSTNRLDGTKTTYDEWITDFNANWTGYDEFEAPAAGTKYVSFIVHVQATTAGVDAGGAAYDASLTDSAGNVYSRATATYGADGEMPQVTLGAGQQASGIVVFQVPTSVTGGVATFGDGTVFEALQ